MTSAGSSADLSPTPPHLPGTHMLHWGGNASSHHHPAPPSSGEFLLCFFLGNSHGHPGQDRAPLLSVAGHTLPFPSMGLKPAESLPDAGSVTQPQLRARCVVGAPLWLASEHQLEVHSPPIQCLAHVCSATDTFQSFAQLCSASLESSPGCQSDPGTKKGKLPSPFLRF